MAKGDSITVYLTRYALSQGITKLTGKDMGDGLVANGQQFGCYYHTGDYSLTKEDAIKAAEAMRQKKIKSLKAQIAKLEKRVFDDVEVE